MKGTSFQKPLEFNLLIEGESWHQGDPIQGSLTVKNHGPAGGDPAFANTFVHLALGGLKKVRLKSPDAFKILATTPVTSESFSWSFPTDRNGPITDNSASLFILYGQGDATEKLGQLQLLVHPFPLIQEILEIFKISFRFVFKSQKTGKGSVEVKLAPPASRGYAAVELLQLSFRFAGESLEIDYAFSIKVVEASATVIDIKKDKKTFKQVFTKSDYLLPSGRTNHDRLEAAIKEILDPLESKILL